MLLQQPEMPTMMRPSKTLAAGVDDDRFIQQLFLDQYRTWSRDRHHFSWLLDPDEMDFWSPRSESRKLIDELVNLNNQIERERVEQITEKPTQKPSRTGHRGANDDSIDDGECQINLFANGIMTMNARVSVSFPSPLENSSILPTVTCTTFTWISPARWCVIQICRASSSSSVRASAR